MFFHLRWSLLRSVVDNLLGAKPAWGSHILNHHLFEKGFTGAAPFSDKPPRAAMSAIVGGKRPPRPTDPTLTDGIWTLTQQCWDQEAQLRPQALQVVRGLCVPTL